MTRWTCVHITGFGPLVCNWGLYAVSQVAPGLLLYPTRGHEDKAFRWEDRGIRQLPITPAGPFSVRPHVERWAGSTTLSKLHATSPNPGPHSSPAPQASQGPPRCCPPHSGVSDPFPQEKAHCPGQGLALPFPLLPLPTACLACRGEARGEDGSRHQGTRWIVVCRTDLMWRPK